MLLFGDIPGYAPLGQPNYVDTSHRAPPRWSRDPIANRVRIIKPPKLPKHAQRPCGAHGCDALATQGRSFLCLRHWKSLTHEMRVDLLTVKQPRLARVRAAAVESVR